MSRLAKAPRQIDVWLTDNTDCCGSTRNGAALKEGAGTLGLLGIVVMLCVLAASASAFVVSLKTPWMRIAVRVAGSWVASSGLLLLG